jgi:ABC-type transport system involved in multi-copper enzyme maturation permease subunit
MMSQLSTTRVRAIVRKELQEYRRNGSIVVAMAVLPLVFTIQPLIEIFTLPGSSAASLLSKAPLVYLLGIPVIVPAAVAGATIVNERVQGTLEPVLTTPIRREELLLAKAIAVLLPGLAISYLVFGLAIAAIEVFADPAVASAVVRGPELLAQLIFTPLLAAWSIWVGIAISTRARDPRVASQLGILASLPLIAITTLVSLGTIQASVRLAAIAVAVLLAIDVRGWRLVSSLLDREWLITGTRR